MLQIMTIMMFHQSHDVVLDDAPDVDDDVVVSKLIDSLASNTIVVVVVVVDVVEYLPC